MIGSSQKNEGWHLSVTSSNHKNCQAYHPSQHVISRPTAPRTLHLVATAPVAGRTGETHQPFRLLPSKGRRHTLGISLAYLKDTHGRLILYEYMRCSHFGVWCFRLAGIASSSGSCGGWACNSRVAAFTLSGWEMEFLWPLPARSVWWLLTILEWKPRQPQKIHITWWCLNAWGPVSPEMKNDTSKGATTLKASEKHPNGSWKTLHVTWKALLFLEHAPSKGFSNKHLQNHVNFMACHYIDDSFLKNSFYIALFI